MAYTSADLTAIRAARLRGTRSVTFADRTVTYSSDAELRQVEQDILLELSMANATTTTRRKQLFGVSTKGL